MVLRNIIIDIVTIVTISKHYTLTIGGGPLVPRPTFIKSQASGSGPIGNHPHTPSVKSPCA
jgi:hypothetical protein